jgi:hypothetical protein
MSGFNAKRLGNYGQNNYVVGMGRNRSTVASVSREYNYLARTTSDPLYSLFQFERKPEPTVPPAPIDLFANVGVGSASISFTQPSDGGSRITNYEYNIMDLTGATFVPFSPPQTKSPVLITGLMNGREVTIALRAVNAKGPGASSDIISFTTPDIPVPPTDLSVIAGDSEVYVYFRQLSDGGSEIMYYEYSTDNGETWGLFDHTDSPITIDGLSNGTIYTIRLRAINAVGTSGPSEPISVAPMPINSFNPSNISGLNLWLDAQYLDSVIIDSNKVDTWNDRSGQNNHFTKGNNDVISYAIPSGINSRPALHFVDSGTNLEREFNIAPSNELSFFMVVYHVSNGIGNSELFFTRSGPTNPGFAYFDLFSNTNTTGLLSFNIGNQTQVSSGVDIRGSISLISMISTSNVDLYVNGSETLAMNKPRGTLLLNNLLTWSISGGAFRGFIGEIVTYPSGLNDVNRQKIEGYLAWKWGLQENLPDNQPYKNAPPVSLDAPVITGITGSSQTLSVAFTQNTGGQTITNYLYSTDNGSTFREFEPSEMTSPLIITKLSSDGTTLLTNGDTYNVKIQAKTPNGLSPFSNMVEGTPDATTIVSFRNVGPTTWTAPANVTSVEYLVVGGGGGSGATHDGGGSGGGGGGMVLTGTLSVVPGNIYSVIVGDGGDGGVSYSSVNPGPGGIRETDGNPGDNSEFSSILALGGGQGYKSRFNGNGTGGASASAPTLSSVGGYGGSFNNGGGGGGGDSGNGSNGTGTGGSRTGGSGGTGTSNGISGISLTYGRGGNGGTAQTNDNAETGAVNTGNGANGAGTPFGSQRNGAKGGSGIVILKYTQNEVTPVTNNLQLSLLPENGTTTTWSDTEGNLNVTMTGSPSYDPLFGYTFDGTSQYGRLNSQDGITNFTNADSYTVELWFNPSVGQPHATTTLFEKWNSTNQSRYPYVFRYTENTTNLIVAVYDGTNFPASTVNNVTTGTWHQVVGVFNFTTDILSTYKNGVAGSTTSLAGVGNISNTSEVGIAHRVGTSGTTEFMFKGSIGIIRIYNRALSSSEILQNFNANRDIYEI